MIYLDNAATTRIAPEVLNAMMPYLTEEYGNAGTLYNFGRRAASAIQNARGELAALLGCQPENVIFTSGGSESNNMVFKGLRHRLMASGRKHLVVSAVEHDSVLKAAQSLTKDGFDITYIQPDKRGSISARAVDDAIRRDTGLVSVMYVNNETGAVNPIEEIGEVCRRRGVLFHTDCVQAAGQYIINAGQNCVDFASVSSHKLHGPKGVGALYIKSPDILPLICGGAEQEFGLRGGTENVAGIVGFGKAAELTRAFLREDLIAVSTLKQRLYTALRDKLNEIEVGADIMHINGQPVIDPGKILNIRFDGVDAETLLLLLDAKGICVSAGSACRSHEAQPSHVLTAMGLSREDARSSIRVSFSKFNSTDEVLGAAETIALCVQSLQQEVCDEKAI